MRARIASRVVEVFGGLQVAVGLVVGLWLVIDSRESECVRPGLTRCLEVADVGRDTFQVITGIYVLSGGLVSGSLFVMLGAYVASRTSEIAS